jgi:hypothetical protein
MLDNSLIPVAIVMLRHGVQVYLKTSLIVSYSISWWDNDFNSELGEM